MSNETHPLLRDELLSIKFGPEKGQKPEKVQPPVDNTLIDALGTLTIGSRGEAKYFGRSGGSEVRIEYAASSDYTDSTTDTIFSRPCHTGTSLVSHLTTTT